MRVCPWCLHQDKPAWFSAPDSAALKILINSLQILAILAGISISLPLPALEFMTWAGILSSGVQASVCAISSPCAMLHCWLFIIAYRARMLQRCRCLRSACQMWLDCVLGDFAYKPIYVVGVGVACMPAWAI
jgi:hypothetical protein